MKDAEFEGWLAELEALGERARRSGRWAEWRAALERQLAAGEPKSAPAREGAPPGRFGLVGDSPAMRALFAELERVAASDVPVLVLGETGTGKELVARALHAEGRRKGGPFVAVNCAAVAPNLLESELFGHVRGAFTGAVASRPGHFQSAHRGTLFLDEIGELPLPMQPKLLRAVQEGEVRPVGSDRTQKVDVRLVAATNRDLAEGARTGSFREDLFYRLAVLTLRLPPLRERSGDVPLLVAALLPRIAVELGRPEAELTPAALALLDRYPWPGNVRQLENELRRALALARGPIGPEDLSAAVRSAPAPR